MEEMFPLARKPDTKGIFSNTMNIKYDSHLHSDFSGDSDTPAAQMIERALSLGLDGLCFTEHEDPDAPPSDCDFRIDFDRYFSETAGLREKYRGRIRIDVGMEYGIQPHLPEAFGRLSRTYPFDFIIASLHNLNGMDPYYPAYFEGRAERDCYEEFFRVQYETLKLCDPASFDTLGHMDYIVRYGLNRNKYYSYESYAELIDPILRLLIENGKCLEVNTGGLKYGLGEPNPCTGVLKRYRELGGELVTVGSDAHEPAGLCYRFGDAAKLLKRLGFRYYTVFERRIGRQIRI